MKLHIKRRNESRFLYETNTTAAINDVLKDVLNIYNGQLKVKRLCAEIEELSKYGIYVQPNMQGLLEEQIKELKLTDEWSEKCSPHNGYVESKDSTGRRIGQAPTEQMAEVLNRTVAEARSAVSPEAIAADTCLTQANITDILQMLQGAVTVVYPMGLPPHDPISQKLKNEFDLQSDPDAMDINNAQLWWAGKRLECGKKLESYIGKNEKTKIIVKLEKSDQGPPSREPALTEEEQKTLMLLAHKRQEELKRLEEDDDDHYLNSQWADKTSLKTSLHGIQQINWKPH